MTELRGQQNGVSASVNDPDPVGYLIDEFEQIILRMAREIDALRARVNELEASVSPSGENLNMRSKS